MEADTGVIVHDEVDIGVDRDRIVVSVCDVGRRSRVGSDPLNGCRVSFQSDEVDAGFWSGVIDGLGVPEIVAGPTNCLAGDNLNGGCELSRI